MNEADIPRLPDSIPIFGGLTPAEVQSIQALLTYHQYDDGDLIASEGEIGSEMFIIAKGTCQVSKSMGDGQEPFVLAECGAGEVLGEMALIEIKPRSATLRAQGDVGVFTLANGDFLRLYETNLHTYTMVLLNVSRELSRRLRRSNRVLATCAKVLRDGYVE